MTITLDEIEAFLSVVEFGGFTRASLKLNRSQPAISRRIHLLEQALENRLFERQHKQMQLTSAGRAFLPYASAALAAIHDGKTAVQEAANTNHEFSVVLVGTLADSNVVEVLRAFEAQEPEAKITLRTANSHQVSQLVKQGEAHLGLRYFADSDPLLENTHMGAEALQVVVSAEHPVKLDRISSLTDLAEENWLSFPKERGQRECYADVLQHALQSAGVEMPRITIVDSLTAQKRLIEAGFGIALMPTTSCREELQIGTLRMIAVKHLEASAPVYAVQRRTGYRSQLATAFLSLLKSTMTHLRE